jgi:hypothetical protein
MYKYLLIAIAILILVPFSMFSEAKKMNDEKIGFESGQLWKYETREGEEDSRLLILKIENYENNEVVVHIAVFDVKISEDAKNGLKLDHLQHLPFSEESLRESVVELNSSNNDLPDYYEGYNLWKKAFDEGKAGVFTVSVKEVVDIIEESTK